MLIMLISPSLQIYILNYKRNLLYRHLFYEECYIPVANYSLNYSNDTYIGDKDKKVCRFCGKGEEEVTFELRAHVLPECIGNKYLLSYYECDICNKKFGKSIEGEYSNFFNFYHNALCIKGKKNIPAYQTKDQKSIAKWKKDNDGKKQFMFKEPKDSITTYIDIDNNELRRVGVAPTYIPMGVFKCFIKMAIGLLPDDECFIFKDTIKWLSEKKYRNIYENKQLYCRFIMIPGFWTERPIECTLYKRRFNTINVPYMLFHLTYGSFSYLIEVPNITDKSGSDITKIIFPPMNLPTSTEGIYNFSGQDKISDFKQHISYQFDKCIDVTDVVKEHPERYI